MDLWNAFDRHRESEVTQSGDSLKQPLVLVIDDDPDARILWSVCLSQLGYCAASEANGEDGIRAALELHPLAILMDLNMPVLGGLEATRRVKAHARTRDCLVVAVTAQGTEMMGEAKAAGCDAYFCKPFNAFLLDAIVRACALLEKRGYKRSAARRCPCRREYTYPTWSALPFCGRIHSPRPHDAIEVRTCPCGYGIAMPIPSLERQS